VHPTLIRSDIRYWRLAPDPRLRSYVSCYFVAMPPSGALAPRARDEELLLPDGHSELVFILSGGFERWPVDQERARHTMRPSYLIGGRSHSVLTRAIGELIVVGAKLDCAALRSIIRTPLADFREGTLSLADLNQRALLDLEDAIANAPSVEAIRTSFDRFFLDALRSAQRGDAAVIALQRRIRRERGALPLMQWMRSHRLDPRNFERRFCEWTGLTPKRYARVIRFKHSYHRFISGSRSTYLEGYYDQSHFNREFKYFIGIAPSARGRTATGPETGVTEHLLEGELLGGAAGI
jgi:AraC-like DNA-binding protein